MKKTKLDVAPSTSVNRAEDSSMEDGSLQTDATRLKKLFSKMENRERIFDTSSIHSVSEAHEAISDYFQKQKPFDSYIGDLVALISSLNIRGDTSDYHNAAVELSRNGRNKEAIIVCEAGLQVYRYDVDLIADSIQFATENADFSTAQKWIYYLTSNIPQKKLWNWRAFSFILDYLMNAKPENYVDDCWEYIEYYKKNLPYEEKAFFAEAELLCSLGDFDKALSILEIAINKLTVAPQCALRLADMYMERGQYAKVLTTTIYGFTASAETQPSVNVTYLLYLNTLAKEALLHKAHLSGRKYCVHEIETIKTGYEAVESMGTLYGRNIASRIAILDVALKEASEKRRR